MDRPTQTHLLSRLSLSRRFVASTAVLLLPLALLAASGYVLYSHTVDTFDAALAESSEAFTAVGELERALAVYHRAWRDRLLRGQTPSAMQVVAAREQVSAALQVLRQTAYGPELPLARLSSLIRRTEQRAEALAAQSSLDSVDVPLRVLETDFAACEAVLGELTGRIGQLAGTQREQALTYRTQVQVVIGSFLLLGLVAVLGTGLLLAGSVLRPLRELEQGALRLGEGALGHRVPVGRSDEFGQLATHFNRMAELLQAQQARLREMASRDPLTDLYNKREFTLRLQEEAARAARYRNPLCLIMLDIDHFKPVNDSRGHRAGDRVLQQVAELLTSQLRPADTVARYGGEEFVIIMPQISRDGALATAERIRHDVSRHAFELEQGDVMYLTVSLGVAEFGRDAHCAADLVEAADRALYMAKGDGRNRVCLAADAIRN